MSIRLKLLTGFIVLILIFSTVYIVNRRLSEVVLWNSEYITKSETVLRNSNMILKHIIDMQSSFRGYLLTAHENFLVPYRQGKNAVPVLIDEQRKMVTAPVQQVRLDSILLVHHNWLEYADEIISTRRDTADKKSYQMLLSMKFRSEVGKKMNDHLKELFNEFNEHEYMIRRERRRNMQISVEETSRINLYLSIGSVLLALLSSYYFAGGIVRRIQVMVGLAEDIARGKFRTITDKGEDELRRLSDSLNAMSVTLKTNFEDLQRKNRELDEFAYVVSHDLKAPLRGIDNLTKWMEEDNAADITPAIRKNLDLIKGRTRRLENLINGLLAYARIGRTRYQHETVDVGVLLRELSDLLIPKGFTFTIEGKMPEIQTVRVLLQQVFSNLISNAVKYNDKPAGSIIIRAQEQPDHFIFEVEDNGPGIEKQYHEKIFKLFQTLKERDAFESTGIGLAIVKRIVESMNMSINVNSTPGKGTVFIFTWPRK